MFSNISLDSALGKHVTSGHDPIGARAAMVQMLRHDDSARRALCRLLERDYKCFGYDLFACLHGSALSEVSV